MHICSYNLHTCAYYWIHDACICMYLTAYLCKFPAYVCICLHMFSYFQFHSAYICICVAHPAYSSVSYPGLKSLRQKTFGPPQLALHKAQQVINLPRLLARQQVISSTAVAVLVRCKKPRFHPADSCSQAPSVLCCNMIASSSAPNLLMKYLWADTSAHGQLWLAWHCTRKVTIQQGWESPCQSTWQSWISHHWTRSCHTKALSYLHNFSKYAYSCSILRTWKNDKYAK